MTDAGFRVLMTADAVGGVFTYATTLAWRYAARGITVHLALMGSPARPAQRETLRAISGLVVHESNFALEWEDEPWDAVGRAGEWLLRLEQQIEPRIVHLNGYAHGRLPFAAPKVVVAHSCVLSWWEAVLGTRAPERYAAYEEAVRAGLAAADAVIAPSRAMLACLERHYFAGSVETPMARAVVVHNGAAPAGYPPAFAKEPFVLTAGRVWDRAKNIEALGRVARRIPWPVRVAGDAGVERECRARGALAGAEVLGWLSPDELSVLMDRAAVFALPARYEPFGLGPLEAAQRGCALVLGDIDSLREIWGDSALFVNPDDDAALAFALTRLATHGALRARLGASARERAASFSAERMATKTLDVYRRVLANPAGLAASAAPSVTRSLPSCA